MSMLKRTMSMSKLQKMQKCLISFVNVANKADVHHRKSVGIILNIITSLFVNAYREEEQNQFNEYSKFFGGLKGHTAK